MLTKIVKNENETESQFLWRIGEEVASGKYSWDDITPYVNEQLYGDDKSKYKGESAYRKKVQAATKFYDEVFSNLIDDEYSKKIQKQRRELEEEKIKLRDERTELNKSLRIQARIDESLNHLRELIVNTSPYEGEVANFLSDGDNDLIVCISDYHLGGESKSTLIVDGYDESIAKQRLTTYLNKVKDIAYHHQSENAYVFLLGDIIDGRLRYSQAIANRMNLMEQIQQASEDISWFIYELSKCFNTVYVTGVAGNHSRIGKKDDVLRDERLDDMIIWYMQAKLQNVLNISFEFENLKLDPTIAYASIRGKQWIAVHGDFDDYSSNGVGKLSLMCGFIPYGILCGHIHTTDFRDISGVKYIRSGTFASGGDYVAKQRLKGKPSQAVCVVDDNGVKAFYPVEL